jgi:hypothetical protein
MSGRLSFIALAALSRKKALIVEPISHTWRNNSSYSSGRSFTVTRTVQVDLRSVSFIRCCFFGYLLEELRFNPTLSRPKRTGYPHRPAAGPSPTAKSRVSSAPVGPTMSHPPVENEDQSCRWLFLMEAFCRPRANMRSTTEIIPSAKEAGHPPHQPDPRLPPAPAVRLVRPSTAPRSCRQLPVGIGVDRGGVPALSEQPHLAITRALVRHRRCKKGGGECSGAPTTSTFY